MGWPQEEKRRFLRVKLPCKIIIHTPREQTIITETKNVSAGGVRVMIEEALQVSSMIDLELFLPDGTLISCKARVVWMMPDKQKQKKVAEYDTGIEFYEISPKDRKAIKELVESIFLKGKDVV